MLNVTVTVSLSDLRLQHNILINNEVPPRACIADFGFSTISLSVSPDPNTHKGAGGTFGYMAPELFQKDAKSSKEADIYAFGVVVYEVVTGVRPFRRYKVVELPLLTKQGLRPTKPDDPVAVGFGSGTWELIERCWNEDFKERPTAGDAVGHFERIVATSIEVDPGSVLSAHSVGDETSHPIDENLKSVCQCYRFVGMMLYTFLTTFSAKLLTTSGISVRSRSGAPDGIFSNFCKCCRTSTISTL